MTALALAAALDVAAAILWGRPMPSAEALADLPRAARQQAVEYHEREQSFRSTLTAPRGASDAELAMFDQRVGIERVLFSLFPRRDIAKIAATYASDADISPEWEGSTDLPRREAAFIDALLRDRSRPWLAPYLNLVGGNLKLCAGDRDPAIGQLKQARDDGPPLIRVAAEELLRTMQCVER